MSRVAVITRTKNRSLLLNRAIISVLQQTHEDWEHVIVNDGGDKERVEEVVSQYRGQYRNRLRVIHNDKSKGMEAASNIGIDQTSSKYIVIHDDDDSWNSNFLKEMISDLESFGAFQVGGIACESIVTREIIWRNKVYTIDREVFDFRIGSASLSSTLIAPQFPPIAFLFKRSVYEKIGPFREDLPVHGDWEFNLRFLLETDIAYSRKPLANYHHRVLPSSPNMTNAVLQAGDRLSTYRAFIENELIRKEIKGEIRTSIFLSTFVSISDLNRHMSKFSFIYISRKIYHFLRVQLACLCFRFIQLIYPGSSSNPTED